MASSTAETTTEDETDRLTALSPHLVALVLRLLQPEELVRLSSCSKYLFECVAADDVWRVLCGERQWAPASPSADWHALYLSRRARLCMDCGESTQYVFKLLRRRLCERCEATPAYRLITEAQALEFGVSPARLSSMPFHELRGVLPTKLQKSLRASAQSRFYLLSAVENLVEQMEREERRRSRRLSAKADDGIFSLEDCDLGGGGGESDADECADDNDSDSSSGSEEVGAGSSSDGAAAGGRRLRLSAEEKKAARRRNKEATKTANREKRAAKSAVKAGGGSLPDVSRFLSRTPPAASPPGSLPCANRKKGGRGGGARPKRWGSDSPAANAPSARARVDDALGSFGISGLELCV